nr:hypothetical protein mcr_00197 [Micrococcus sp.]
MREFLNENTLFATVAMYIKESNSLLLVVEGDDDHLALGEHCSPDLRLMAGTGGREQVLRTAAIARKRKLKGVRFLVDRDYDSFTEPTTTELDNVWVSTRHDIFMDLIENDPTILHRVIEVHTARARRRQAEPRSPLPEPKVIEGEALSLAALLAAVRIVNAQSNLNLDFTRFSFFNLKRSEYDVGLIADAIMIRSGYTGESADVVRAAIRVHAEIANRNSLPVGDHDLFAALSRVLKQFDVSVSDDILQKAFIVGISCRALTAAVWFTQVQEWCAINNRTGFDCENRLAA